MSYIVNPKFETYINQKYSNALMNEKILYNISTSIDASLPLHVFLFHDICVNILEMIQRINFNPYVQVANIMIVTYDHVIKLVCPPIFVTNENLELLYNSIHISNGSLLTLSGNDIEKNILNKTFICNGIYMCQYNGPIYVHQLN